MHIFTIDEWAFIAQVLSIFFVYSFFIDFGNFVFTIAYKYRYKVNRTKTLMKMKFINHKPYDLIGRYRDLLSEIYGAESVISYDNFSKFKQFKIALFNFKNIKKGGF